MNAGIGVSATPANGTAQTNSTAKTTTTASAGMRSRRVAGMFERKMLRSSPIVVSGKLAANAPWQELQRAKTIHPARSDIQPILGAAGIDAAGIAAPEVTLTTPREESTQGYILPDDAGKKTRPQCNRLFTDWLNRPCGTAEIDEFKRKLPLDRSGRLRCPACLLLTTRPTFVR